MGHQNQFKTLYLELMELLLTILKSEDYIHIGNQEMIWYLTTFFSLLLSSITTMFYSRKT